MFTFLWRMFLSERSGLFILVSLHTIPIPQCLKCCNKSARGRVRKSCAISAVCAVRVPEILRDKRGMRAKFPPWGRGIYGFRGWDGRPDAGGATPA